ncbi:GRAM domain-containing protein 1A [Trichonephila inaurata madagascariensis]|uniref:GRAM domain-containing protein 1A n=1 Tax=Trichonephila inaurata madagascariensis TaxID=2747483 RepID=A0A8X7CLR5_9ARAC|nr:GRAM domain-containing protein 1A [Trichonephila inaurata madagascariensis]
MIRNWCLQEKRCVSMPSVSLTSSNNNPTVHKSRLLRLQDRRFRHRFSQVPEDEKLLNYFEAYASPICIIYLSLVDLKILIPVVDVVKVTKEKIAKFIPNAVGVYTESDKYVFGSMLSRDTAFRVIQQTWILSTDPGLGLPDDSDSEVSPAIMLLADEDSSVSSGISGTLMSEEVPVTSSETATTPEVVDSLKSRLTEAPSPPPPRNNTPALKQRLTISRCCLDFAKGYMIKIDEVIRELSQLSRTSLLFVMSTLLLVVLFISTTILLYRIHLLHQKLLVRDDYYIGIPSFERIPELHPTDFSSVVKSLEERIQSLSEVRTTLEKLLLMANNAHQVPRSISPHVT